VQSVLSMLIANCLLCFAVILLDDRDASCEYVISHVLSYEFQENFCNVPREKIDGWNKLLMVYLSSFPPTYFVVPSTEPKHHSTRPLDVFLQSTSSCQWLRDHGARLALGYPRLLAIDCASMHKFKRRHDLAHVGLDDRGPILHIADFLQCGIEPFNHV